MQWRRPPVWTVWPVALAAAAFLVIDYFFLPPYHAFRISDPRDWMVLTAVLLIGVISVALLERARAASALREADRLKDALLASLSHDLRTPLTTIRGLAEELCETGDERALIIREEADRLNAMVADLLDLSRLTAGGPPVHPELNAVDDLVGAALERVAGATSAHPIHARVEAGADPVLVGSFDLTHALRALVNLIENAARYSPAGTPIDVIARRDGPRLLIEVVDHGPGIPEEERERIFAPFYRARGTPPEVRGTGLGLSIARGLAEAQGGTVRVAPAPGGGSIFTLVLPAASIPFAGPAPVSASDTSPATT
jgi:two-component system sensor histidine kinase KdpD